MTAFAERYPDGLHEWLIPPASMRVRDQSLAIENGSCRIHPPLARTPHHLFSNDPVVKAAFAVLAWGEPAREMLEAHMKAEIWLERLPGKEHARFPERPMPEDPEEVLDRVFCTNAWLYSSVPLVSADYETVSAIELKAFFHPEDPAPMHFLAASTHIREEIKERAPLHFSTPDWVPDFPFWVSRPWDWSRMPAFFCEPCYDNWRLAADQVSHAELLEALNLLGAGSLKQRHTSAHEPIRCHPANVDRQRSTLPTICEVAVSYVRLFTMGKPFLLRLTIRDFLGYDDL